MSNSNPTKRQVKARAALLGCEIRYSGRLGRGFVHRVARYQVQYDERGYKLKQRR